MHFLGGNEQWKMILWDWYIHKDEWIVFEGESDFLVTQDA